MHPAACRCEVDRIVRAWLPPWLAGPNTACALVVSARRVGADGGREAAAAAAAAALLPRPLLLPGMADVAGLRTALGARIGAWGVREDFLAGLLRAGVPAAAEAVLAADLTDVCVCLVLWSCAGGGGGGGVRWRRAAGVCEE